MPFLARSTSRGYIGVIFHDRGTWEYFRHCSKLGLVPVPAVTSRVQPRRPTRKKWTKGKKGSENEGSRQTFVRRAHLFKSPAFGQGFLPTGREDQLVAGVRERFRALLKAKNLARTPPSGVRPGIPISEPPQCVCARRLPPEVSHKQMKRGCATRAARTNLFNAPPLSAGFLLRQTLITGLAQRSRTTHIGDSLTLGLVFLRLHTPVSADAPKSTRFWDTLSSFWDTHY